MMRHSTSHNYNSQQPLPSTVADAGCCLHFNEPDAGAGADAEVEVDVGADANNDGQLPTVCRTVTRSASGSRSRSRRHSRRSGDQGDRGPDEDEDEGDSEDEDGDGDGDGGECEGVGQREILQMCGATELSAEARDKQLRYPAYAEWTFRYLHQSSRPRNWCLRIMTWRWFERVSILVILLNCVTLACYRPCEDFNRCDASSRCQILSYLDNCVFAFFIVEMIIKIIAMGFVGVNSYLSEPWNRFDFIIILVGIIEFLVSAFGQSSGVNLTAIRTARVLRPLRAINRIPSLRILVTLLLDTLPMLGNVLLLCFFVFFIFGIMGVQMWSSVLRQRCRLTLNRSVLHQYGVELDTFYRNEFEPDFLCGKHDSDGMRKCDKVPPYRDRNTGAICSLTVEAFEQRFFNSSSAGNSPFFSSSYTMANETANTTETVCINWNYYYSECIASDKNPFLGAISFDNIGFAWVAIFQVISLESWVDIMYSLQDTSSFWSWIYFVFLIVIGAFFMINLCLVVIATQFSETKKREIERMRQERLLSTSSLASSADPSAGIYRQVIRLIAHYLSVAKKYIAGSCNRALGRVGELKSRSNSVLQLRRRQCAGDTSHGKHEIESIERWAQPASALTKKVKVNGVASTSQNETVELQPVGNDVFGSVSELDDSETKESRLACIKNRINRFRSWLRDVIHHRYFQRVILIAILINTLSMGIEHHKQPPALTEVLEYINIFFTSVFAVEMVLKLAALGLLRYVSNAFNVFDAIIVVLSIVELCQDGASGISVLRTFRLMRIFKVVRFLPALKRQLVVMLRTMDNVATFFILLLIFIFVFSVLGMNLFGCQFCDGTGDQMVCDRKNFDSFLWAMVTVFQILTQEDWNSVLYMGMAKTTPWASLYFVALMTFGNYVLFNLLVAILVEGFSSEKARLVETQRKTGERVAKVKIANKRQVSVSSSTPSLKDVAASIIHQSKAVAMVTVHAGATSSPNTSAEATTTGEAVVEREHVSVDGTEKDAKQNGCLHPSATRLSRRTPVPTITHTPATPSRRLSFVDVTVNNVAERRRRSEPSTLDDTYQLRSLSEILMSVSRRPAKPFMASEVSLESIDKSVATLNCLCSPTSRSRKSSKRSSLTASTQLLTPASKTSLGPLRLPRKSILCTGRKSSQSEDDTNVNSVPGTPSSTASSASEIVQLCDGLSQHSTSHDSVNADAKIEIQNTNAGDHCGKESNGNGNGGVDVHSNGNESAMTLDFKPPSRPQNRLLSYGRVILQHVKHFLIKRREYSLYIFSESNRFRQFCQMLSSAKWFDFVILAFIIANCIALAIENPHTKAESVERHILTISNYIFTGVFTTEMAIKIIASGLIIGKKPYANSGWNRMDFFLVASSLLDLIVTLADGGSSRIFAILRVFRLLRTLRPLRVINRAPGLKLVVQTLLSSLKPIGNIVLICCTFFIIFGILGVQLFKGKFYHCEGPNVTYVVSRNDCLLYEKNRWVNRQYNFDNLGQALISLFVLASRDGWVEIMYHGLDAVGEDFQPIRNYSEWRLLYFICFLLLVGFFVLNMFVGVVVENFQKCRAQQEAEDQSRKIRRRIARMRRRIKKLLEFPYWEVYKPWRQKLHSIVTSKYFDLAIAGVIGLNVITMAMEFYMMPDELKLVLEILNYIFTGVFILEAIFRVLAIGGKRYVFDKWNQLDLLIICLSIIGIFLEDNGSHNLMKVNPTIIRVFRVMRIARVLKLLKMAKGIRQLLDTVIQALPQVGNLGLLFFLLFYIFAALGVELFGKVDCDEDHPCVGMGRHANFKSFGTAFLTLFRIATGDNWNGIMKDTLRDKCDDSDDCQRNCCVVKFAPPFFFVVFVLVAQFVLVNVVIAVLMRHLQDAHRIAQEDAAFTLAEDGCVEALTNALSEMPDLDEETRKFLEELRSALPDGDATTVVHIHQHHNYDEHTSMTQVNHVDHPES